MPELHNELAQGLDLFGLVRFMRWEDDACQDARLVEQDPVRPAVNVGEMALAAYP
jgi:hypothetical protein